MSDNGNFHDFLFFSVVSFRSLTVCFCQDAYQLWKSLFLEVLYTLWGFKKRDVVVFSFIDEINREGSVKVRFCEDKQDHEKEAGARVYNQ